MTPAWPNLNSFIVGFNMISPSEQWYFAGQRPANHEDDDPYNDTMSVYEDGTDYTNYREHGAPAALNPFLAAFARAVQRMPMLEQFKLDSEVGHNKGRFTYSTTRQVIQPSGKKKARAICCPGVCITRLVLFGGRMRRSCRGSGALVKPSLEERFLRGF